MVRPYSFLILFPGDFTFHFYIPSSLPPSLTLTQVAASEIWRISHSTWFPNVHLHQQSEAPSILVLAGYVHQYYL